MFSEQAKTKTQVLYHSRGLRLIRYIVHSTSMNYADKGYWDRWSDLEAIVYFGQDWDPTESFQKSTIHEAIYS